MSNSFDSIEDILQYITTVNSIKQVTPDFIQALNSYADIGNVDIAKAVLSNPSITRAISRIPNQDWDTLETRLTFLALHKLSYEETIQEISRFIITEEKLGKFFAERIANDPIFAKAFISDKVFAPFIAAVNPTFAHQFNIKPADFEEYCKTEMQLELGENVPATRESFTSEILDIIKIRAFLSDKNKVMMQLKQLEKILQDFAGTKGIELTADGFADFKEDKSHTQKKIMSSYLSIWAQQNNFKKITTLDEELLANIFFQHITNKELIKDKGLGTRKEGHGEWTHIIQWWCIFQAYKDKENTGLFLSRSPDELYSWLGQQSANLWNYTVESSPFQMHDKNNFRNVLQFFFYLISDQVHGASDEIKNSCPLIYQLIKGRMLKRDEQAQQMRMSNSSK